MGGGCFPCTNNKKDLHERGGRQQKGKHQPLKLTHIMNQRSMRKYRKLEAIHYHLSKVMENFVCGLKNEISVIPMFD